MTPEQLQDLAKNPLAMLVVLALVILFLALYCICASAKVDKSCYPSKCCLNCKHKSQGKQARCAACRQFAPVYPYWEAKEKGEKS